MTGVWVRRVLAVVVTAGFLALVRVATVAGIPGAGRDAAWVRLSWSARPERVETCRRLTDEELALRPPHMRLRMECTGKFASYHLTVRSDGVVIADDTVRGGGFRNDRPMHVLRDLAVTPGSRRIEVGLVRIDSAAAAGEAPSEAPDDDDSTGVLGERGRRERDERARSAAAAIAPVLGYDTTLVLDAGRVLIVTWDNDARRLVGLTGPGR